MLDFWVLGCLVFVIWGFCGFVALGFFGLREQKLRVQGLGFPNRTPFRSRGATETPIIARPSTGDLRSDVYSRLGCAPSY